VSEHFAAQGGLAMRHNAEAGQLEAHLELELLFGGERKRPVTTKTLPTNLLTTILLACIILL
jgi:hypothetical protein